MGVSLDNRARTEARQEENAAKLDAIRLYTLTELEPILGSNTQDATDLYQGRAAKGRENRGQVESLRGSLETLH